ncbi:MAG: tetratricopeptide repeat protein, partial [Acidobacteriales bacterium]|nr:tetratricopeptide repeat protein [Terriglobales bacterium]
MARNLFRTVLLLIVWFATAAAMAQTFELSPSQSNPPPQQKNKKQAPPVKGKPASQAQPVTPSNGIGWGSGIEVARQARSAQQALEKGNYNDAAFFAQRAANSAPQDTALWFTLGYAARLSGQYSLSESAYKRGLTNQPSSIAGLSGLAQTYAKMGRTQEAQDLLKQVIAANPQSVTDLQLAGELALNSDAKTALSLLRRAENIDPSSRNELLIARAYQRLDLPADAKIYLDRAVARSPGDISVLRALGAFYREDRKYDLAIAALEKAAAGNDTQARAELAYTYQLAGRKADAAKNYAVAADKATGDTGLQLSAAQALVNIGDLGRADVYLKRAANHDANHYRLHSIRGQIAALKNQPEEAIKEYQAALQNLPPAVPEGPLYPVQLHLSLYELYRTTDQAPAAAGELTTAKNEIAALQAQEQSNQPEYLRLRGLVEAASDDTAAAERDFQQALKLDPKSVTIMLNYANLLLKVNRKPEAYKLYQQAIEIDPNNNAGLTALGYLARELADAKTAESYFLRVLALYPNDYVPYLALGDLYT